MGGGLSFILPLILLAGMMFFMTRSQKKQQNERQTLLDAMKVGDEVVTIGGLHGVISEIDSEKRTVLIDCEGIILEFDRAAIKTVKPGTVVTNDSDVTVVETEETIVEEPTVTTTSENNETKE
ncbi:preprotein translocase, YajC subunit [Enterococcus haemoperoxidus ATCC BAA-382]|uniref:Preprotein translocase, YajC subunit n=1 Tax=Enterococcus haemoperoxidus ATCC BAA-382 TaxID=1158608 RepID=R2SCK8_9ENTE|nr:preprotein translocase subunit YajC [Enterococcus haemoperoxidus]EOH93265.1 preprotein translocase, YajC subunit [Enterococcus haemoperoxidus ATCC BAA-382]EOT61220.1 preprotein translocase, YajC subunit [Enterococcus haemoperoxidus ATCC BAA-382]OJG54399.1 preprotein translocase, YajC subunit [Enterococcus haemoperoxidus]